MPPAPEGGATDRDGREGRQEVTKPPPLGRDANHADDGADAEGEEAVAAVVYAYQRADGRRHDLDPIPSEERTWTTWSFLSL